jgi:hypothetical protein
VKESQRTTEATEATESNRKQPKAKEIVPQRWGSGVTTGE